MERALVVVDETDAHRELLREAGDLAAGVGAELVLLSLMTEAEYEEDVKTMEKIAETEGTSYGDETILDTARSFARDLARETIDRDVEYDVVGRLAEEDERADAILETAEEEECDHVFITGRRRSPTGKAIFGDTAQSVILNFDGPVTVITA